MLDRLSLLLCSRELLGHVTGCVAEETSLGYRNLEEPNLSASLCQPDTARGGAPGPQVWTSHDPETITYIYAITFVARGQVQYGALSELKDCDHPRACPSVLLTIKNLQ